MKLFVFTALIICGIISGFASYKKFSIKKYQIIIYPLISATVSALYYHEFGLSVEFVTGAVLVAIFLFFSTGDIKTRKVSDIMHVLIFAAGFVFISKENLLTMIAGAFVLGLIPLVAAVVKPGTFGGADIKFLAAAGWLFGIKNGVTVMVMGLLFSIIGTLIVSVVKKEKIKRIPMIPYFCFAATLIYSTL